MYGKLVPLPRSKVTVYANGAQIQSVSPGFDGSYSIALPAGLYVVTAEHPGFNGQTRLVAISDWHWTPVDFHLEHAPAITGNAFDFGLSSGSPITVFAGELGWTRIQVTLRSGLPQMVNLSVSGLPSGALASLNPPVGSPSFASVCIVTTSLAIQMGSYNVTVTGVGGGLTRSTSFMLTVNLRLGSPDKP